MNEGLVETLGRIMKLAEERGIVEEMRGSITYKRACPKCDGTGWEMVTRGRMETAGGIEVTASEVAPVARRCPSGCKPPMTGRKSERPEQSKRELKP